MGNFEIELWAIAQKKRRIHSALIVRANVILIVSICLVAALVFVSATPTEAFAVANKDLKMATSKNAGPLPSASNSTKAIPAPIGTDVVSAGSEPRIDKKTEPQKIENVRTKARKEEILDLRTSNTKTYLKDDGSKEMVYSAAPKHYKDGAGKLQDIVENVKSDNVYQNKVAVPDNKAGLLPLSFDIDSANVSTKFKPFSEGIDITFRGKKFSVYPVDAKNVSPTKSFEYGVTKIVYKDAWPGVDVEYEVSNGSVKENIVIKNAQAQTSFSFGYSGVNLTAHPTEKGAISFKEFDPSEFFLSSLSVGTNSAGIISEPRARQSFKGNTVTISIDKIWVSTRQNSSFPIIIDPNVVNNVGGSLGDFRMFKSDGYTCTSSICTPQAGGLNDGGMKYWRTIFRIPFDQLQGKTLLGSYVRLVQRLDRYGYTGEKKFATSYAPTFNYNCISPASASPSSLVGTDNWFDNTATIDWMMKNNIWGGWMCLYGEENGSFSYKQFASQYLEMSIYYDTPTPMTTSVTPANKSVIVNTQPSLKVNPVVDADGEAVQYYYRIATNPDAETGAVINSGWVKDTKWTIPDNILQDGQTYYWHVYTMGGRQTNPNWVNSFKVDMRTGRDSTQAYQDFGPIGVSLATGNATTGSSSHSISALGGTIGVGLSYNSPALSRPGLVGQYWNNKTVSGAPVLSRVDQDINFDWVTSSPSVGTITDNGFSARWTGYISVPTSGSYTFGANADDGVRIKLGIGANGSDLAVLDDWKYVAGNRWGAAATLTAGQVIPIIVEYFEDTGPAYFKLLVKGSVAEQVVPTTWFQTGARDTATNYGLEGRYYNDPSKTKTFPTDANDPNRLMLARRDGKLNFYWGTGSVSPGLPADSFMARWKGFISVPTTGSYTLGARADDGVRVKLGIGAGGADQTVVDGWAPVSANVWGTAVTLTAGQLVPITVEYYENLGSAEIKLLVRATGIADQEVPVTWLSPNANVIPDGWDIGLSDGDVRFERLKVNSSTAVLSDTTGETYEYNWINNGYVPPKDVEAILTRNADNSYTVLDTDGKTYVFDSGGKLVSVTSPEDDRKPAALKYEYAGSPSKLIKIVDGVTSARSGSLYYSGDSNCAVTAGFDAVPTGMLCAFKTTDGQTTRFQYKGGNLSRIEYPGNANVDYGYDSLGRIVTFRDVLANDVIASGFRANDEKAITTISYDALGRASSVTTPAPSAAGKRIESRVKYLFSASEMNLVGASEPKGYSRRVEYDSLLRTVKSFDLTGLAENTEWDSVKDLIYSTTGPTGLKSTTIYNENDLPIDNYGPAPSEWFGADRKPISARINDVPRSSTGYDEGLTGLGVQYFDNKKLLRAPKLNATVTWPTSANVTAAFASNAAPVTPTDGWGARYVGKVKLNSAGAYTFRVKGDAGYRLYVDDQLIVDGWGDGNKTTADSTASGVFSNSTAGATKRIRIDQYHQTGVATNLQLYIAPPGGAESSVVSSLLSPDYGLQTSSVSYDAQLGNVTSKTQYKSPEYGLVEKNIVDPGGLNLENNQTYENAGSGYFRQLSNSLPGGATTTYEYYGADETRDNPCTVPIEAFKQAGFIKAKNEPDPDGAGAKTSRRSENIFDDAGNAVASRYNSDSWTCFEYDSRNRATRISIPAFAGKAARVVTNNYAVGSNPLIVSSTDEIGTITVENNLLGATIRYVDVKGKTTVSTYDDFGKLISRTGLLGTEEYGYDSYDRQTTYKLDGTLYATLSYDAFNRVSNIVYPSGVSLSQIQRDSLQRENGVVFNIAGGATLTDSVNYSTSGNVISGTENGLAKTYTYDRARRLTGAVVGGNSFGYEFGTPDAACSSLAGNNANASKSSNRTKSTVNGVVSTSCYDQADRLISSSGASIGVPVYDSHGNTTQLGSVGQLTSFSYDSSDRNVGISQTVGGVTSGVDYVRDVTNRVVEHTTKTGATVKEKVFYGYAGGGDSADALLNSSGVVIQKYLKLPGDVLLTIKPGDVSASGKVFSVPKIMVMLWVLLMLQAL